MYYRIIYIKVYIYISVMNPQHTLTIEEELTTGTQGQKVHLRIQSRTTRKSIMTITGLENDLDLKRIVKYLKKNLRCNGAVVQSKDYGDIIQLQGDHRESVKQFLIDMEICNDSQIIVHGA
jgi:translation initiation factor 1